MAIDLTLYSNIKDKCCVGYFGNCDEYLYQLLSFRGHFEAQLPDLQLYIAARDSSFHHISKEPRTLSMTQFRDRKLDFGFYQEVLNDADNHPIGKLLSDNGIERIAFDNELQPENDRCLIVTKGSWPTVNLTDDQVQSLMELARSRGLKPEFGDDPTGVGAVYGVESWQLWKHLHHRQKGSVLVDTGVGTEFYAAAFPLVEIWK